MCVTVSTEANCCNSTSREDRESLSTNTSLVPLNVSNLVPIERRYIEEENVVGKLTGTVIFGEWNLHRRVSRWKKKVQKVNVVKQTKKDMTYYALSKALQLQEHGEITFSRAINDNNILRPIVPEHFSLPC